MLRKMSAHLHWLHSSCDIAKGKKYIKGAINTDKRRMLFFSIPYDRGWKAFVNGKETKPILINIGFMGLMLDKGKYTIELKYTPPLLWSGLAVSVIAMAIYGVLLKRTIPAGITMKPL